MSERYELKLNVTANDIHVISYPKGIALKCKFCHRFCETDDLTMSWYFCEVGRVLYCEKCIKKKGRDAVGCLYLSEKKQEHTEWIVNKFEVIA